MASQQDIFNVVQRCLAKSLAAEPGRITLQSRLIEDLGADSLDFVDIVFELERQFGIKLNSAELDSLLRTDIVAEHPNERGFVPRSEIEKLADWLPALRGASDPDRIAPFQLFSYITTESLVLLVQRRLDAHS